MKILMIHDYYINRGGEDVSFESEVKMLRDAGHEVITYTKHNKEIINAKGTKMIKVALNTIWNFKVYKEIKKIIKEAKPDIVHFQNTFPIISPSAYWACKSENVPAIQALRNYRLICPSGLLYNKGKITEKSVKQFFPYSALLGRYYRDSFLATLPIALMLFIHRIIGTYKNKVDAYIAVSEFVKRKHVEAGFDKDTIMVKRNVASPQKSKNQLRKRVIFFGRLTKEKGILTLIKSWKSIKEFELTIIGEGPLYNSIKKITQSENLKNVSLIGFKKNEELDSELNKCSFVICPSEWYEPAARTIIESFSRGIPVIASNIGGNSELIVNRHNGLLFEAGNFNNLAKKILLLTKNEKLIRRLGANAKIDYLKTHSPPENCKALMTIYEKVMQEKKPYVQKTINQ